MFTQAKDISKRRELQHLMQDWKALINTKAPIVFPDDGKAYAAIDYFNDDGFFPGYFSTENTKILFLGRESRYSSGKDRVSNDLQWFQQCAANGSSYWRRILYLAYGIQSRGKYTFEQIPEANRILFDMVKKNHYGFAIMNISKYSNDADNGATADFHLINQFLKDSDLRKRNFIREEIALLEPDIIIAANLWESKICKESLELIFPSNDFTGQKTVENVANLWNFQLGSRKIKFLDLYHFSTRGSDKDLFYDPVMHLLFNSSVE